MKQIFYIFVTLICAVQAIFTSQNQQSIYFPRYSHVRYYDTQGFDCGEPTADQSYVVYRVVRAAQINPAIKGRRRVVAPAQKSILAYSAITRQMYGCHNVIQAVQFLQKLEQQKK